MDREKLERPSGHPLEIRTGHNPIELSLMWATIAGVIPALFTPAARGLTVGAVFPEVALVVWYALLLLWAVITVVVIMPRPVYLLDDRTYPIIRRRLHLERIGVFGAGGTYLSFGFAVIAVQGLHGLGGGAWLFGVAVGLFWRGGQVNRDLHKLTLAREGGPTTGHVPVLRDPIERNRNAPRPDADS